ncbi:MAG: PPOX class F420-dependent oxidoreductase [Candidatus Odinarchaeota archaeon]
MIITIPENYLDLFEKKAFGILATINPDGSPHASIIWVDYDGQQVMFNSITRRQKYRNIQVDPRVSLVIVDPDDNYRYMEIRGVIVEITVKGAEEFVDKLAKKYLGVDRYPHHRDGITRVIYKLNPEHVHCYEN